MCNTKRRMKIMNKKFYIAPESRSLLMEEELMKLDLYQEKWDLFQECMEAVYSQEDKLKYLQFVH